MNVTENSLVNELKGLVHKKNRVPHLFFSYMKNQTSTTAFPGIVGNASEIPGIEGDDFDVELFEVTQQTTNTILLGKDKVTRFYICISIVLGISILITIFGIIGYVFHRRRSFQEMEMQTRSASRRRSRDRKTETSPLAH
ncbi:uncharacterized protein LOC129786177 [Lutzomyia longipalpis]|uniref:uncharacterized protein LOC129786177 n=1 Tax=Lutzomyia longipalpis TaxID=7200 RepID=UPI00248452A8|nr:uncharacterized protein LOC129786177 [Lutzomyia longipalpis]